MNHAECTVWTEGAFNLASSTVEELHRNLRDSDFGVFVFAPDDVAEIKGTLLNVTRDNVVFEAGLFSGFLTSERFFIAIPQSVSIRIPTDLLGITLGHYEDLRTDKNLQSAVSTFCGLVEGRIQSIGSFTGLPDYELRELATKFECCDWIPDNPNSAADPSANRVAKKREVVGEIDNFFQHNTDFNKHRLVHRHRIGYYMALLRFINKLPESGDHDVMMKINLSIFLHGFNYYSVLDAAESLRNAGKLNAHQKAAVKQWLQALPSLDSGLIGGVTNF